MVEKKTKAEAPEPKAAKKTATPKAEHKAEPKKETAPKAATARKEAPAKAAHSGKTITLVQTGSPIGRQGYQRDTLIGLGLNKMGRTRTLQDTPSIRGMITKVKHLVKVISGQ